MPVQNILSELVSVNSVFPGESQLANRLCGMLSQRGFRVRKDPVGDNGRFNVLAERGKSDSGAILFYGHMDTVPRYGAWKTNAFKLTRSGDKLYGLGACDMKGGIATMLEAVSANEGGRVKLLFCVDEENISRGAWNAARRNRAWFKDVKLMVSGEPGISRSFVGGANVITLGRRGRSVIVADIVGRSSHGANPETGINAVEEASVIATNLHRFKLRRHGRLGTENIFTRMIQGASTSLSIPDKAHMEFDVQTVPPCTAEIARDRIIDYVNKLRASGKLNPGTKVSVAVKQRPTPYINPYESNRNSRLIRNVMSLMEDTFSKPNINYATSAGDENIFFNETGKTVVTIGPAGGNEHSANEWVSSRSLGELLKVYSALINEYERL